MKLKIKITIFFILLINCFSNIAYAEWLGPSEIVVGAWGKNSNEFFIDWKSDSHLYGDAPVLVKILNDGTIVVADEPGFKSFNSDGVFTGFVSPSDDKFLEPILRLKLKGRTRFQGYRNNHYYIFIGEPSSTWLKYSLDGDFIEATKNKPHIMGHIGEEDIFIYDDQKLYRHSVSFPDRVWSTNSATGSLCGDYNYIFDAVGNLYCVNNQVVTKYSECGVVVATFILPENNLTRVANLPGVEDIITVNEAYGTVVMDNNANIYTSKITQNNFSIIKWTWQDSPTDSVGGPSAPTTLKSSAINNRVQLSWIHSLQDPGCVTAYEVGRSESKEGDYTIIATVQTNDINIYSNKPYEFTDASVQSDVSYYYAVRAVSSMGNSEYSNQVNIKAP